MRVPSFVSVRNGYLASLLVEKHLQNRIFISLAINAERTFSNSDFFPSKFVPISLELNKVPPSCYKEIALAYEAMIIGKSIEYIFVC